MTRFRTLRGRLTAGACLVALLAVAAVTVAFNVALRASLDADANNAVRSQAAAALTTVAVEAGRVRVRESPGDAAVDRQVWVYQGRRAIERAVAEPALQREADALAGRAGVHADVLGGRVRLYAAPVTDDGRGVGTVVAGLSLAAYDRTTDLALIGSLALAAMLLGAVFVLTWAVIGRALRPVREMTRDAADWSEHGAEERFGAVGRPDELGELARTFDALLDRVAASLRHEQRLTAELSHELRTPLARIVAEVELLERRVRSAPERRHAHMAIARSAGQMSTILETLMAAARADAQLDQGRSDLRTTLDALDRTWTTPLAERRVALRVHPLDAPLIAGVDHEVVERIVAPLLENAGRYARSRVDVEAERRDRLVRLAVSDDGPGIPAEARERVFEPGVRVGGRNGHAGAGLGLALARRLARAAGGDVTLQTGADGPGATFVVELPG